MLQRQIMNHTILKKNITYKDIANCQSCACRCIDGKNCVHMRQASGDLDILVGTRSTASSLVDCGAIPSWHVMPGGASSSSSSWRCCCHFHFGCWKLRGGPNLHLMILPLAWFVCYVWVRYGMVATNREKGRQRFF